MRRLSSSLFAVGLCLSTSACLEKCAPGQVGPGVARLTVRNVGAIVQLANDDTRCGFESEAVKYGFTVEGENGKQGAATWTVEGCEIDLTESPSLSYDCNRVASAVSGKIVVNARRTVRGTLTGDREQPVVPVSPDAVSIELTSVELFGFRVESSDNPAVLTQLSGKISAVASPRLAASAPEGICQVPTPNIEIKDIAYENARVHVVAEGRSFDVDVPRSNIYAVNGKHGEQENVLDGDITVWGSTVDLPSDGDGLNPDYDAATFSKGFECTEKLALPVSHECAGLGPVLAQGAARLTIRNLGAIAFRLEKDEQCGFSSEAVLTAIQRQGDVGSIGEASFRVENCTLDFANEPVKTSCTGSETKVSGRVTVTASKRMRGRLTGNLQQPVVPMTDSPVDFVLERVELDNFKVEEAGTALTQISGSLSAAYTPRTAMDTALTACGFKTPISRFYDVRYTSPASVIVKAAQGQFEATIEDSNLSALNGTWGSDSNLLDGSITMLGESFLLPTNPADDGLDPEFDQARFDASWQCGTLDYDAPFECHFVDPLAQGASQLSTQTLGTLTSVVEADSRCGFSSDAVLDNVQITGDLGEPGGNAVFTIATPCELSYAEPTVLREDCNGKKTYGQGTVRVTGHKILRGYVSGDRLQPIVPTTWDPAEIELELSFADFEVWTEPGNNGLRAFSGTLNGTMRPRTAIDTKTGACSIPTGVLKVEKMIWRDGRVRIDSEDRVFDVAINSSNLTAVNGPRDTEENLIGGSITIDGEAISIPINEQGLDPEYDRGVFLNGFACEPDIQVPVAVEECDMSKPLGEGAARLVIAALGAVTSVINTDTRCGYSKLGVLTDPSRVVGDVGQQGLMEWQIEGCEPDWDTPFAEDCLGRESFMSGGVTMSGMRTVTGTREEISILFFNIDSISPNDHESVRVQHDSVVFNGFETYDIDRGAALPLRGIQFHTGTMSAVVNPITGQNRRGGAYDIPTKVARMSDVLLTDADATILYQGKTFNVHIERASLAAFNGSFARTGEGNQISGQIVIDGKTIPVPAQGLDPDFDQADFDARYACTNNLSATIPPARVGSP